MAKSQKKSTREAKKPKKNKNKTTEPVSVFARPSASTTNSKP